MSPFRSTILAAYILGEFLDNTDALSALIIPPRGAGPHVKSVPTFFSPDIRKHILEEEGLHGHHANKKWDFPEKHLTAAP